MGGFVDSVLQALPGLTAVYKFNDTGGLTVEESINGLDGTLLNGASFTVSGNFDLQ